MQAHELFHRMGPDLARDILMFFRETERNVYKSALTTLAQRRNLRPVFVQQKSVSEQCAWLTKELSQKRSAEVAEQLLQVWLMQARQAMLVRFLDVLGIPHDGKGAVDELPENLDAAKLKEAVDALLAEFQAKEVAVYMHIFNDQRPGGWAELAALLAEDPRLALETAE
jgi:hypothetical protein